MRLERLAPAKLNLSLRVLGRRDDGYHELESLVVFASIGDRLIAEPADALTLDVTGPFAAGLADEPNNLVLRAARALSERLGAPRGARLTLEKRLPVASGIGGGSADAAATLLALNDFWEGELEGAELAAIGQSLGADIPVCLASVPSMMRGLGERLEPLEALPSLGVLLVNPRVAVPTGDVFRRLAAPPLGELPAPQSPPCGDRDALIRWLEGQGNDLQAPAIGSAAIIGDVLNEMTALPGALLTRMSGSGATCFSLFEDKPAAETARNIIATRRDRWWIAAGEVLPA